MQYCNDATLFTSHHPLILLQYLKKNFTALQFTAFVRANGLVHNLMVMMVVVLSMLLMLMMLMMMMMMMMMVVVVIVVLYVPITCYTRQRNPA